VFACLVRGCLTSQATVVVMGRSCFFCLCRYNRLADKRGIAETRWPRLLDLGGLREGGGGELEPTPPVDTATHSGFVNPAGEMAAVMQVRHGLRMLQSRPVELSLK
jgi:hypothetical protein